MKIDKICVEKFRHIENQTIEFGSALTVISGLNGTGKSSLLGLSGHFFVSPDKALKSKLGKTFETKQSEVFRFCANHDYSNVYSYTGHFIEDNDESFEIKVSTRYMPTENRYKFDIDGRGNKYKWPVIYLGLKRLFPIADETKINLTDSDLSKSEKDFYINEIKNIMVITGRNNNVEKVETNNKNYHGIKTEKYSARGNSAGQDNIGQILTAILSFKALPTRGGILLIDELEATLFPAAQINLIEKLYSYARDRDLQIIFTTHSLEIMKHIYNKNWEGVKTNFLELSNGGVINKVNPDIEYIEHKIKAEARAIIKSRKKHILCEDKTASLWIYGLIARTPLSDKFEVNYKNMSDGTIGVLAESRAKCFDDFIFVLDGDCRDKPQFKRMKNVIFLPGKFPPEKIMFDYLKNVPEDDDFWDNERFFDYNACFNGYLNNNVSVDRCKNWFEENKEFFGPGCIKFFTHWKAHNLGLVEEFRNNLKDKLKT